MSNAATKKVVRLSEHRLPVAPAAAVEASPLYGVAMLKIAMELKKKESADLDEILRGVLKKMDLPEAAFREFLSNNGGLLRTIAARKRY
ncbi:MAG: hypothetical protein ACYC8T_27260 [Myxococcaceae bacterium]